MRLKEKFGFVSDGDMAAARNSGQGDTGWTAELGNYYHMSRYWVGNDRLTIEVRRTFKGTGATATKPGALLYKHISHRT